MTYGYSVRGYGTPHTSVLPQAKASLATTIKPLGLIRLALMAHGACPAVYHRRNHMTCSVLLDCITMTLFNL